ncbi:hypothetical protein BT96DRAFT_997986 [Gymnopus androsaceus JB14]|uniref:Uncharacterized protein n=1 Tax=Gymnopus androsaceus JB14 TaxID=1447944 RepID=A0A6A4HB08_9AGAR|nr:hypothetical protein BT96DRAFT_997986 [Gymnopus androsaceus JB14]
MRAYRVYQNSAMLDIATQAWDYGRTLTISDVNVATGSVPSKSFNFTKTCSGSTLIGGTFWQTTANDTTIFGLSTALFFTLSAYLYQATSDNIYLAAAQDSGAFLIDIMHITGGITRLTDAGTFMEGLALLPSNTSFGEQNLSVETLRSNLVNITLTTNVLCNAANGIINTGGGVGDEALVQGLGALYHTISGPADLITYIGNFLSVQYNTLVTVSTVSNSNIYAGSWIGPPVAQYDPTNQTLALFALVNAAQVSVNSQTNSTTNESGGIAYQHNDVPEIQNPS